MSLTRTAVAAALAALPLAANAADPTLDEVVVTAPQMRAPLVIDTDPKAPQQDRKSTRLNSSHRT